MPARDWRRLSAGEGAKGPRLYDWAYLPYRSLVAEGWTTGLLIRRSIREPDKLAFYLAIQQGVYVCLAGPSFETPADLRFLRTAGVDAVGMSTVPEAIIGRHGGSRVMAVSGISNKANLDGSTITTHEEVIEAGKVITPKMEKLIRGVLRSL